MTKQQTDWITFTASQEQIDEIDACKKYKLLRNDGVESFILSPPFYPDDIEREYIDMETEVTTHYMIIE